MPRLLSGVTSRWDEGISPIGGENCCPGSGPGSLLSMGAQKLRFTHVQMVAGLLAQWSRGFGERWSNNEELGVVTGGFVGQTCCLASE